MVGCARWIIARVRRASTSSSVWAISSRAAYTQLRARVGQPGDDRLEQLGPAVGQGQHRRRLGAVAAEEARWRLGQGQGHRVPGGRGADEQAATSVTQRRRRGDSPRLARPTASTVSCAILR